MSLIGDGTEVEALNNRVAVKFRLAEAQVQGLQNIIV